MNSRDDITVEILRDIRDEIRGTNARVDALTKQLGSFEARTIDSQLATSNAALATHHTLEDVGRDLRGLHGDLANDQLDLRTRVERCERAIEELKRRSG